MNFIDPPDGGFPASADSPGSDAGFAAPSGVHYSVGTAARTLSTDLGIRITRKDLFQRLVDTGWVTRRPTGYIPTLTALAEDYVAVVPASTPAGIWDQLVITSTGLLELNRTLAAAIL